MSKLRKWVVCPKCGGEGYVSKLGAFTQEDLDRDFGHGDEREEFLEEYMRRGGAYDDVCPTCEGNRVVEDSPEAREERREIAEMDAMYRAEARLMGDY